MGGKTSVILGDVWVDSSHRCMHNQGGVEERSAREEEERAVPNVKEERERDKFFSICIGKYPSMQDR